MLRKVSDFQGLTIGATDGDIGEIHDVYFDDQSWTVRYLVVDTGTWLSGRRVLISPMSLRDSYVGVDRLHVALTKAQVEQSPHVDTAKPVSRQHETELSRYYGYPYYWTGPYRWGLDPYPVLMTEPRRSAVEEEMLARERESADPHLHSIRDVMGYYIQAADDDVGHVEDFLVDDKAWAIRYMLVDTRNWLPGKKVLISPEWIREVSWADSKVFVDLRRDAIERAPGYDESRPIERAHEGRLYEHYGRRKYWEDEEDRPAA
ncbi:MAG: PRC-barrel domain-containing protein [Candidatus Rokuibacteriota bacterium]